MMEHQKNNNHGGVRDNQTGRPKLGKTKSLLTHYPTQEIQIRKFIENMQPQKFLNQIKKNNQVTGIVTKTSQDPYWDYYVQVLGFLNSKYFGIVFKSNDGIEKIEISPLTEDVENFKEYFGL